MLLRYIKTHCGCMGQVWEAASGIFQHLRHHYALENTMLSMKSNSFCVLASFGQLGSSRANDLLPHKEWQPLFLTVDITLDGCIRLHHNMPKWLEPNVSIYGKCACCNVRNANQCFWGVPNNTWWMHGTGLRSFLWYIPTSNASLYAKMFGTNCLNIQIQLEPSQKNPLGMAGGLLGRTEW